MVCLCAKELRSGQTLRLWRDQLGCDAAVPHRRRRAVRLLRRHRGSVPATWLSAGRCRRKSSTCRPHSAASSTAATAPRRQRAARRAGLFRSQFHRGEAQGRHAQRAFCRGGRSARRSSEQILDLLRERHRRAGGAAAEAVAATSTSTSRCTGANSRRCRRRWSIAAFRSTWRYFRSCRTSEPGRSCAMRSCPRSTRNTASM